MRTVLIANWYVVPSSFLGVRAVSSMFSICFSSVMSCLRSSAICAEYQSSIAFCSSGGCGGEVNVRISSEEQWHYAIRIINTSFARASTQTEFTERLYLRQTVFNLPTDLLRDRVRLFVGDDVDNVVLFLHTLARGDPNHLILHPMSVQLP